MKLPRLRWRPWPTTIAGIVLFSLAFERYFFAECSLEFQFNGAIGVAGPLFFVAGVVAALLCVARIGTRPTGARMTVREVILAIAILGFGMGTARWWVQHNFATVYAPGYREDRFRQVQIGMTAREVVSILGQPLEKKDLNWVYSKAPAQGTWGDNYWRRWVMINGDKVVCIIDDYYVD